ncbi:MAG TPA: hypothetical protein ACFCUC_14015 [Desulfobacterales bacterium]
MNASPCRLCPMKDEDKNNRTCLNCNKRLRYVNSLGRSLSARMEVAEENCILRPGGNGQALAC